jgi:arginine decarboxylase
MNYTLNEYANDVVYRIANVCNTRKIEHPMIVSESGRAIAAHHSVLIFNTLGSQALDQFRSRARKTRKEGGPRRCRSRCATCSTPFRSVTERRVVECYHDAQTARPGACRCSTSAS